MTNNFKSIILSLVSLTVGSLTGFFIAKKKYEKLADEEVESVKKSLKDYYETKEKKTEQNKNNTTAAEKDASKKTVKKNSRSAKVAPVEPSETDISMYKDYSAPYRKNNKGDDGGSFIEPYVITPEEFNESDYDSKTLFLYSDGVLADDDYNKIDDIYDLIGGNTLSQLGKYEPDSLYVRNERYKIDYEILKDDRKFYKLTSRMSSHDDD